MAEADNKPPPKWKRRILFGSLGGLCLVSVLFLLGIYFLQRESQESKEAPESSKVLEAQIGLPFQILIPAYLPPIFKREAVELSTDQSGPNGEPMIQLTYPTRKGNRLVLSEWIPEAEASGQNRRCMCVCRSPEQCESIGVEISSGAVQIRIEYSIPNLLTSNQIQFVLDTLGPAANLQVYSSIQDVPVSYTLPPAVEIPVNDQGIQEVTLVISPQGYSPAHFSVQQGIPVRLTFRQLGQVGCGNELQFTWGSGKNADLILTSAQDQQVLEFTPTEAGVFSFHCPHLIYQGAMTVMD